MKRIGIVLVAALSLWDASDALAQVDSTLLGKRVRLLLLDVHRQAEFIPPVLELRGTLTALGADSLTIALPSGAGAVSVSREAVRRLAVSRGAPSRFPSAMRSAFAWSVSCALLSFAMRHTSDDRFSNSWQETIAVGAAAGAAGGFILGVTMPYERWRRIKLP